MAPAVRSMSCMQPLREAKATLAACISDDNTGPSRPINSTTICRAQCLGRRAAHPDVDDMPLSRDS